MPLKFDVGDLATEDTNPTAAKIKTLISQENGGLDFYTIDPGLELHKKYLTKKYVRKALSTKALRAKGCAEPDAGLVDYALGEARTIFLLLVHNFGDHPRGVLRLAVEKLRERGLNDKKLFPIQKLRNMSISELPRSSVTANEGTPSSSGNERSSSSGSSASGGARQSEFSSESDSDSDSEIDEAEKQVLEEHALGSVDPTIFNRYTIGRLHDDQWKFPGIVPVFSSSEEGTKLSISQSCVLPFVKRGKQSEVERGAFGEVSRVWIHPAHIKDEENLLDPRPESFALKMILPMDDDLQARLQEEMSQSDDWAKEVWNMRHVTSLKLDHCLRFFTAFRCYDDELTTRKEHTRFYLLYEWANGGTLAQLWTKKMPNPVLNADIIRSSIVQLLGMAKALARVHEQPTKTGGETNMRHGDLKPGNILRFVKEPPDPADPIGTLKIGDWGLAKHHNLATQLRNNATSTKFATLRYEPPEAYHKPEAPTTRLYDVWSMGCIILEHTIWLMYGADGLKAFRRQLQAMEKSRPDTTPFHNNEGGRVMVDEVPTGWMNHMATEPCCSKDTPLGDLLKIVTDKLLVVDLPKIRSYTLSQGRQARQPDDLRVSAEPATGTRRGTGARDAGWALQGETDPRAAPALPSLVVTDHSGSGSSGGTSEQNSTPEPDAPERGFAKDLELGLQAIVDKAQNASFADYWRRGIEEFKRTGRPAPEIKRKQASLAPVLPESTASNRESSARRAPAPSSPRDSGNAPVPTLKVLGNSSQTDYGPLSLDETWTFKVDNQFTDSLAKTIRDSRGSLALPTLVLPPSGRRTRLCHNCKKIDFSNLALSFDRDTEALDDGAENGCDLCRLLHDVYANHPASGAGNAEVRFRKKGSNLIMNELEGPALTICGRLGTNTRDDIQSGLPQLPEVGSALHFEIARQWLLHCDTHHQNTCWPKDWDRHAQFNGGGGPKLPTRVILVGKDGDRTVRLRETDPSETGRYIALSHRWGEKPYPEGSRTTVGTKQEYIEKGISFDALPATFRDAVIATRALGVCYLWIDSLCIVQSSSEGPGDFDAEAERMEAVFSGAYCVIAASRATGMCSGFLSPRQVCRDYVNVQEGGEQEEPLYVCQNIDDFDAHVLKGHLNTRGWVFQERALARRTLFFADHQTYFECGVGVHCETMSWMRSSQASFLGDPNFPQIVLNAKPGAKIANFQALYKTYSGLKLSYDKDRPFAIHGLETRLVRALGAKDCLGVIDDGRGLLRRSLLWVREECETADGHTNEMTRIPGIGLPSWSWMAYTGRIDYLTPPSGETDWEDLHLTLRDPEPPSGGSYSTGIPTGTLASVDKNSRRALVATVRDIIETGLGRASGEVSGQSRLVHDTPRLWPDGRGATQCVVIGVTRRDRMHFVLLVERVYGGGDRGSTYRRVGAGFLPEGAVGEKKADSEARIC